MTWNKWIASAALVPTMALGIGCASTPAPAAESLNARSSIRAAQELHAENQPQARYYLALAQEQIVKAEEFFAADDEERGRRLLARAQADADLAIALSEEAQTRGEAEQIQTHVNDLRREHL
ncbi:MAG: DUF4398 domain-containing protein [Sandaracinaceae bacterium]|nr:DUF4398 domain-containing protein [Sandaracinaceae bacterium]